MFTAQSALLLATLLLPVVGMLLAGTGRRRARQTALAATVAAFVLAVLLIARFLDQPRGTEPFATIDWAWLGGIHSAVDIRFHIALDGLSLWFFGLTTLLMVVAVLVSWEAIREQAPTYYRLLLLLETGMLGVFVARDIILFYVFFEFTLIPLFFLIGLWGSEQRRYAAAKFFLFTLAGSLLTFLGLLAIVLWNYYGSPHGQMTFSIPQLTADLQQRPLPHTVQLAVFLALFAGFAIKVPLVPLHTWLPLAHVQAPTAGSVILAGVLLKIGTYGFVRFSVAMLPQAAATAMPWILWLAVAGIIFGALVALAQQDMKRLIAYSSVSHMGFCMLGVFALNRLAMQGGVLQMISHGLATGGLFALVGMLYERYHTRQIRDMQGIAQRLPVLAAFMLVMTFASIGLPGLSGFAGEFLLLLGMFQRAWADAPTAWAIQLRIISVLAVAGVVLGAWYMLKLVQDVFFGPLREPAYHDDPQHAPPSDLCWREIAALTPLTAVILWIGLHPNFFLQPMAPTLDQILAPAQHQTDAITHNSPLAPSHLACSTAAPGCAGRPPAISQTPTGPSAMPQPLPPSKGWPQ